MRVATDFTATATTCPALECVHADTCLPDYWTGHHLPHISVPVYHGMTLGQLKSDLLRELHCDAIAGSADPQVLESDTFHRRAVAAIRRIKPAVKGTRRLFTELEPISDADAEHYDSESVYAYFCFRDLNQ